MSTWVRQTLTMKSSVVRSHLWTGVEYVIPNRGLACSDMAIAQLTLEPQKGTLWNVHPGYEVLIPLRGEAEVWFGEESVTAYRVFFEDGLLAYFLSDKRHRVWNPSADTIVSMLVLRMYGSARTNKYLALQGTGTQE